MKHILSTLLFFFLVFYAGKIKAQTQNTSVAEKQSSEFSEDKSKKNEIGFDMFFFLNLFRQNYEGLPSSIFSVAYNHELSDRISLRTTLGSGYTNNDFKQDTMPTLKTYIVEEDLKIGIAWKEPCYKHWQFYYGVDLEFQYGYNKLQELVPAPNNSVSDNVNTVVLGGPGPFVGLILYVNPRVSFSIEANMNFVYSNNTSKVINESYPNDSKLNSISTTKGITTTYITPQNIFLSIKF